MSKFKVGDTIVKNRKDSTALSTAACVPIGTEYLVDSSMAGGGVWTSCGEYIHVSLGDFDLKAEPGTIANPVQEATLTNPVIESNDGTKVHVVGLFPAQVEALELAHEAWGEDWADSVLAGAEAVIDQRADDAKKAVIKARIVGVTKAIDKGQPVRSISGELRRLALEIEGKAPVG